MSVFIWGTGELAKVGFEYLTSRDFCNLWAIQKNMDFSWISNYVFVVDSEYKNTNMFKGFPVIESHELPDYKGWYVFLPIAYKDTNKMMADRYKWAVEDCKLNPISHYHAKSVISKSAKIGKACWIQENCNVQTDVVLGNGCRLWASSHAGHSSKYGDFVWQTSGSIVCGQCSIGSRTFIGANAVIHPSLSIGTDCIIGSGAIITKDLPDFSVALEGRNNIISKKSFEIDL